MIYVVVDENGPRQVSGSFTGRMVQTYEVWGFPVPVEQDVVFPSGWLHSASPEELRAAGVHVLDDPPIAPPGKIIVSQTLAVNGDGEPYWHTQFAKAPNPPPPQTPPTALQAMVTLPTGVQAPVTITLSADQIALLVGHGA